MKLIKKIYHLMDDLMDDILEFELIIFILFLYYLTPVLFYINVVYLYDIEFIHHSINISIFESEA